MSFLDRLFGRAPGGADAAASSSADTETVRKIVARLEALPAERARFVAAFAYVLSRVADADLEVTRAETARMEEIVHRLGHLPEEQAVLVVEIAKAQNRLFGGTEDFLVTREFAAIATPEERRELLAALFEVAAADGGISSQEEARIKQIASELQFSHAQYIDALAGWREHREVLRGLPGAQSAQ
jgi:uncharacterized tellurite resistance protein B-like protein